jgi:hypothetical protein
MVIGGGDVWMRVWCAFSPVELGIDFNLKIARTSAGT